MLMFNFQHKVPFLVKIFRQQKNRQLLRRDFSCQTFSIKILPIFVFDTVACSQTAASSQKFG